MTAPDKKARAAALESLRQDKVAAGDIAKLYDAMFSIATGGESEPRDRVNAAKVAAQILGIGKPGPEKPAEAPKEPAASQQVAPLTDERMGEVLSKLGAKW